MSKLARNTYSNDLVNERLKREREKTANAEAKKDKSPLPLWLKSLLGAQSAAWLFIIVAFVASFAISLLAITTAIEYIK